MSAATVSRASVRSTERSVVVRRAALIVLTIVATLMRIGGYWDVHWHATVGRDSFWIPPHDLIYSAVAFAGLLGLWFTWRDGIGRAEGAPWPWGWTVTMLGAGMMLSAAPFDDLWHRLYGIDVTIWSPPHMAGVIGGWTIMLGMLLLWINETRSDDARWRSRAAWGVIWGTTVFVSLINFGLIPAMRWSVSQPAQVVLYPALGSLLTPIPLIVATLLTRRWWLPLAVLVGLFGLRLFDQALHGFSMDNIAPLFRQFPRNDGQGIEHHFWFHPLLNIAPTLAVAAVARWRQDAPRLLITALIAGVASGVLILGAVLLLRSGAILHVAPYLGRSRDFVDETTLPTRLLGNSTALAALWAVVFGAIGGLLGGLLVRLRQSAATR